MFSLLVHELVAVQVSLDQRSNIQMNHHQFMTITMFWKMMP
jgi:hypothetical protein